jgi:TalC/MipB family fructose-6-phosphate aldolase
MKLFLASANTKEIIQAYEMPIAGVLTNPSIIKKEKRGLDNLVKEIDQIGDKEFGLQIAATNFQDMMAQANLFKSLVKNRKFHLKIPFCLDAFKVIEQCKDMDIILNLTAVSSMMQAIMALESEIDYLSIYVGRVTSAGGDGVELVRQVKRFAEINNKKTEVLAASVRDAENFVQVANAGADGVAIAYPLLESTLHNDVTRDSILGFSDDWDALREFEK